MPSLCYFLFAVTIAPTITTITSAKIVAITPVKNGFMYIPFSPLYLPLHTYPHHSHIYADVHTCYIYYTPSSTVSDVHRLFLIDYIYSLCINLLRSLLLPIKHDKMSTL